MKKIIYFLFVCVGAFYACKDEEQVLLNADFISDKQTISAGEKVYFMDKSAGEPVRWDWAFEGGEPSVSNLFSPEIVYNYPGTYTVKLRVGQYPVHSLLFSYRIVLAREAHAGLCD